MKHLFYLSTCSTCNRIINDLGSLISDFKLQDIKTEKITEDQINQMASLSGSYESLFSRRAMKYKSLGLADKSLSENDYKGYILDEYTFLKRPVFIVDDSIFIGNSAKTISQFKEHLENVD